MGVRHLQKSESIVFYPPFLLHSWYNKWKGKRYVKLKTHLHYVVIFPCSIFFKMLVQRSETKEQEERENGWALSDIWWAIKVLLLWPQEGWGWLFIAKSSLGPRLGKKGPQFPCPAFFATSATASILPFWKKALRASQSFKRGSLVQFHHFWQQLFPFSAHVLSSYSPLLWLYFIRLPNFQNKTVLKVLVTRMMLHILKPIKLKGLKSLYFAQT